MKARNRLRLLAMDIENRVQLSDLQEVGNFLIQVQELYFSAFAFYQTVSADQFTQTRAIDVVDSSQVHHNFLAPLAKIFPNEIAQQGAAFTQRDSSVHVDHRDVSDFTAGCFETHGEPF